jgi:exonuclease VII small subunit
VAPKPDNLRLDDLEKAVTSLANGMASLQLGTARLAQMLARESILPSGHYRSLLKEFDEGQAHLRAALEHLTEAKKDGE